MRATNTLENIEEDDLDERDPGRQRRGSNPVVDKRREAGTFDAHATSPKFTICREPLRTNPTTFSLSPIKRNVSVDWVTRMECVVFAR